MSEANTVAAASAPSHAPAIALYVYFRSRAEERVVAEALVRAGALLEAAGWPVPTVWRRPLTDDGPRTWMEVHAPQPAARVDALLAALQATGSAAGLAAILEGERHVERFEHVSLPMAPGEQP